jgi:hypothetical protein
VGAMLPAGLDVLDPAAAGAVTLGDDADAVRVVVRPLVTAQIPAFARAIEPIVGDVSDLLAGGLQAGAISALVQQHLPTVIQALAVATVRPAKGETEDALAARVAERAQAIEFATIDQTLELLLAVLGANKDFLHGRLAAALKTAATLNRGAGPTPSTP